MRKILFYVLLFVGAMSMQSCQYNVMVDKQETVEAQWSQVENVYQRRADLIPNLVSTVKGYANHEKEALTAVIEARAKATSVTVDPSNMKSVEQFQQAQDGLSSALSKLMVVVERYPDLKANEGFLQLQSQLEGTENRITVERGKYNDTARAYNTYIREFPNNIVAGMFDFEKAKYFEAKEGSDVAPKVEF